MALPVRQQASYWGIAAAVFFVALWYLGDVILPFVLGGAIAYLLDPVADRLERMGLSRVLAVVTITLIALLAVVLIFLLVIPALIRQAGQLVEIAPTLVDRVQAWLALTFPDAMEADSLLRQQLDRLGVAIQDRGGQLLNGVVSSALSVINVLVLMFIVPVVTFYLLLDWDRMVARVDELIPLDHAPAVRSIMGEIDRTIAAFIRGQGVVCIILGTGYALGLMAVGLSFGLVIGLVAGLISFIPYVGALVGGALALGLGLFQFWGDWVSLGLVGAVFLAGQFIEGNILTPKLVGNSVGLHPVWLIFALSVFGSLFGFVGMLVAVPVSAALGVVARFFIAQYKTGLLYQGRAGLAARDDTSAEP